MTGSGRAVSVACLVSMSAACDSGPPPPATASEACVALQQASAAYYARCKGGSVDDWLADTTGSTPASPASPAPSTRSIPRPRSASALTGAAATRTCQTCVP